MQPHAPVVEATLTARIAEVRDTAATHLTRQAPEREHDRRRPVTALQVELTHPEIVAPTYDRVTDCDELTHTAPRSSRAATRRSGATRTVCAASNTSGGLSLAHPSSMSDQRVASCNLEWLEHVLQTHHQLTAAFAVTRMFLLSPTNRFTSLDATQSLPMFGQPQLLTASPSF
jgi:hypothetical protein